MFPGLTPTPPPTTGLLSGTQRRPAARPAPARQSEPAWLVEHRRRARQLRVRAVVTGVCGLAIFGVGAAVGNWLFFPVGSVAFCLSIGLFAASRLRPIPPEDPDRFSRLG